MILFTIYTYIRTYLPTAQVDMRAAIATATKKNKQVGQTVCAVFCFENATQR